MPAPVLLVIDDEPGMLALVERVVRTAGYRVAAHTSAHEGLASLSSERPDVALVDLQMPELGGLDVLRAIRERQPQCAVILMTAHASVDSAIEAVKAGALDYLTKPLDFVRLQQLLDDAREDTGRRAALLASENATAHQLELCGMIGRSPVMQQLFGLTRRLAPHARTALITGETGAGKEGIARAIHDLGPRRGKRFVTINCSAVVETLFESELFGHTRGAFTGATDHKAGMFELADGGTLFLDEIGELPTAVQAKLLRVLESGEVQRVGSMQPKKVDVRIVAATNRDLRAETDAGRFRGDLFYRLNVVELHVPALRERGQDIPYLTAAFVKEFASRFHKQIDGVSPSAERVLMSGHWAGNVRELRNTLERACMLADGSTLTERDLTGAIPAFREVDAAPALPTPPEGLDAVEREHIVRMLAEVRGNKLAAAKRLGISRRTLYRRLERHGLMETGGHR
jgi:DNA-binding NtrC family response regulator